MNVSHQPVEDVDVAVHRDVNVVGALGVRQVLLEILHVRHQQLFVATEVFVHLLVFIAHVDDDRRAAADKRWGQGRLRYRRLLRCNCRLTWSSSRRTGRRHTTSNASQIRQQTPIV